MSKLLGYGMGGARRLWGIRRFFPVQLVVWHLTRDLDFTLLWLLPLVVVLLGWGSRLGIPYLFLEPEYLDRVSFLSFFWLGLSWGWATLIWNLVLFLTHSRYVSFLMYSRYPLLTYLLNNGLLPLLSLGVWSVLLVVRGPVGVLSPVEAVMGYWLGASLLFFVVMLFLLQRGEAVWHMVWRMVRVGEGLGPPRVRPRILPRLFPVRREDVEAGRVQVVYYLSWYGRWRRARPVREEDIPYWRVILRRHHATIFLLLVGLLAFVLLLGWLSVYPLFRLPAGAVVYIWVSVLLSVGGAFVFWLAPWHRLVFLVVVGVWLVVGPQIRWVPLRGSPYTGLSYSRRVSLSQIDSLLFDGGRIDSSYSRMRVMLARWRMKNRALVGGGGRPPLVVVCVSGGGLRSALWTFSVLQRIDSLMGGTFLHRVFLITGASGGMLGAAFFRELWWRFQRRLPFNPYNPRYRLLLSRDLLNSVVTTQLTHDWLYGLLGFRRQYRIAGGYVYPLDRGLVFETNFLENTRYLLGHPLSVYSGAEFRQEVPLLVLSPVLMSSGRFLLISAQSLAYVHTLFRQPFPHLRGTLPQAIDFLTLVGDSGRGVRLVSALRASASFPVIMPAMELPTDPPLFTTDAGLRDNFGVEVAFMLLYPFRDWIRRNTSGVVFVVIRDMPLEVSFRHHQHALSIPSGRLFMGLLFLQDLKIRTLLLLGWGVFGGGTTAVSFVYNRPWERRAALSWHLTARERRDILQALDEETVRRAMDYLVELLLGGRGAQGLVGEG